MNAQLEKLAKKGMLCDPGEHFVGKFEVELKFQTAGLNRIRQTLADLGAIPFVLNNTETDLFFDWRDARLSANGQTLVLREMQPSQRVLWISKGPGKDECVSMDLPDLRATVNILHSLGVVETYSITKKRDIYFLGDQHITLDTIENLGSFVEVACMSDDEHMLESLSGAVWSTAAKLGLSRTEQCFKSYRQILTERET